MLEGDDHGSFYFERTGLLRVVVVMVGSCGVGRREVWFF